MCALGRTPADLTESIVSGNIAAIRIAGIINVIRRAVNAIRDIRGRLARFAESPRASPSIPSEIHIKQRWTLSKLLRFAPLLHSGLRAIYASERAAVNVIARASRFSLVRRRRDGC